MEENCVGDVREPPERYDLLTAVMVCLGGPEDGNYEGLLRLLGVLLSADIGVGKKQEILERDFDIPMTEKLEREVTEMCNLSDGVMAKGIERGMEQGMAISVERLMEKLGLTAEQAMDTLGIPECEWPKYKAMVSQP